MDKKIIHIKPADADVKHKHDHPDYEYVKRELVPKGYAGQCAVSMYEIPPHKSAYPYHYHIKNEECFYIISGQGVLKTPEGERAVEAGDFLFFPANENGAHKLTNTSDTFPLIYLDFDTNNDIEVAFYPDSGKVGIWGKEINKLYMSEDNVDYYKGE